jgi:signal transduction histidine kinase
MHANAPLNPLLPKNERIGWLGIALAVVLLGLMATLFIKLGTDIVLDQHERGGVRRLLPINQLVQAVQLHRGVSNALLAGNASLADKRSAIERTVAERMANAAVALNDELRRNPSWWDAQAHWQDIVADGQDWTSTENFNRHSAMIARLLDFMVDIADHDNLSVDREIDTYYLQDTLVIKLPELLERLGQLRGRGVTALTRKELPDSLRIDILTNIDSMGGALRAQGINITKVIGATPELANTLNQAHASLNATVERIVGIMRDDVLAAHFSTSPVEFFQVVSGEIDKSYEVIYNTYIPALEQKLSARIDAALRQLLLIGTATLVALIGVVAMVRQVLLRSRELAQSNRELEAENLRRQQTENELRVAVEVAHTASRAKTQFLANLSHEVRTPLNGVLGMAGLLAMSEPNDEQLTYINELQNSGTELKDMLDRILDFTHIEAGAVKLDDAPLHLPELFAMALRAVQGAADAKGLSMRHSIADNVPALLMGDARRLQQIILVLLDNAVKFTEAGEVTLSASGVPIANGEQFTLQIEVADTGIGVPADLRDAIFESFVQGDGSITRKAGGNGLGLAIARALVKLMHGEISVQSRDQGGSIFRFSVQLGRFDETL